MNDHFKIPFLLTLLVITVSVYSQTARLSGKVSSGEDPIPYAKVFLKGTKFGTTTDVEGKYEIKTIPDGTYTVQISALGFVSVNETISFKEGCNIEKDLTLKPDVLDLEQIVITGSRNKVERYNSPVIVNTIGSKTLNATQSMNIADGLNFSPGLRVENNCQNCGFTQLRMNGLDGPYTQILINSRPVFSALAGVYGLELLPANMVEKIEVVRGGGSVMYGGNAIAGTVNILTKDPYKNTFEVGLNQALVNGETSDRTMNMNGSIVSEDMDKGIALFGFNRTRDFWDANGDGFSEVVHLNNNTLGFDAFYNIDGRNKLKLGAYYINEFRRGGNKFDLFPHQTDVTEQLQHLILSTNASYDHYSKNDKHKVSVYGSLQHIERGSYYGGGGRIIKEGDTLTNEDILAINAYGNSEDISAVGGVQYSYYVNKKLTVTTGSEYIFSDIIDEMPGYGRVIDQRLGTWGTFAELEIKPINRIKLLVGGRFDQLNINGSYDLQTEKFRNEQTINVFIPRVSAMFNLKENLKLRASFAQGYRGPQAFDEDLHIETVGGSALFVALGPNLEAERSNSGVLSLNYDKYVGKNQMNFVLEGFYTELLNPFIYSDQEELPNGVAIITKRNGEGATVAGINLEANIAFGKKLIVQSGATLQTANYAVEEILWEPETPTENIATTRTTRLLRTPDTYGFFSIVYKPVKQFSIAYSGVITGSMLVPHVVNAETEQTVLKETPSFFENNIKFSYAFHSKEHYKFELFGGVQNILNSYQNDFDFGADRDAGYVYGPIRPRTFFLGIKFGLD